MGINYWGAGVGMKGYKALATAGTLTHNIDGSQGKRIAIVSLGFTPGEVADAGYIMVPLGWTTLSAAAASGATGVTLTADPTGLGTSDVVVILLDNGSYQWTTLAASTAGNNNHLTSALTAAAAAGNPFYYMGVYSDDGHMKITTTASTQKVLALEGGYFYGSVKGGPVRFHFQVTSSGSSHVDFVNYAYIDK